LSLLMVIVSVFYMYQKKSIQILLLIGVGFVIFSNTLLFITLPRYANYLQLPTSMTEVVAEQCDNERKVLFYPFDLYVTTSYLDTFSIYPYNYLTPCNAQLPEKSTSIDESGKSFLLYTDETSSAIDAATTRYINSKNLDKDYIAYKEVLDSLSIQLVVIDPTHHDELRLLQNHLDSRMENLSTDKDTFIYKLP
jgi:hypothetical protein